MLEFDKRDALPAKSRPVVRTHIDGVPVYNFGYSSFYAESPTLVDDFTVQKDNHHTAKKIHPKKSWEIKSNRLGATPPRIARTPEHDYQPLECINLIDGNDETCWSSRYHACLYETPLAWVRIDLAKAREIYKVVLKKRKITYDRKKPGSIQMFEDAVEVGRAMPGRIIIKASLDAYHWDVLFDGQTHDTPDKEVFEFVFKPETYRQIWILGDELAGCESWMRAFSIASVEIYDKKERNIALASYGNGITASSTFHGLGQERETHDWLWPIHMDLGLKYSRIGYHDDMINWHWVEREKGVYSMDPEAEKAINLLVENGVEIVYALGFGNRLYQEDPTRYLPQLWEWYFENPEPPKTEEALEAWANFVRYSVNYYKDRIHYFEVWNEWNGECYWGDVPDTDLFIKLSQIAIRVIRECAPDAYVMMGSYSSFCHGIHKWTEEELAEKKNSDPFLKAISVLAKDVDVIGYHPFYQIDVGSETMLEYSNSIVAFKRYCESCGFKGDRYMASEYNFASNYPVPEKPPWGSANYSEIQKAKIVAGVSVLHTALNVESFFCELWSSTYPMELSLMRRSFEGYPISPLNPHAAYYAMRNLSTALDELVEADFCISADREYEKLEMWPMRREGEKVAAVWFAGVPSEDCDGQCITFTIDGEAEDVRAFNCMTGEEFEMDFEMSGGQTVIKDVIVRDYPLLLRLTEKR